MVSYQVQLNPRFSGTKVKLLQSAHIVHVQSAFGQRLKGLRTPLQTFKINFSIKKSAGKRDAVFSRPENGLPHPPDRFVIGGDDVLDDVVMKRRHWRRLVALVQDAVGVRRNSLLGRGVEVVRSWVVFVSWNETNRIFCVAAENQTFASKVIELVEFENRNSVLNFSNNNFPSLLDPEVEVAAPKRAIKVIGQISVPLSNWQRSRKVQHCIDLGQVLDRGAFEPGCAQ